MKTIKIIDLYILIANEDFDKLPKKIKYKNFIFVLEKRDDFINYKPQKGDWLLNQFLRKLNDEVKILEDEKKIPEKMPYKCSMGDANSKEQFFVDNINTLRDKINEILDYLESKGDK